jgi:arylsulfatase A-like enzyme/Flp pilus assembly protein TadD
MEKRCFLHIVFPLCLYFILYGTPASLSATSIEKNNRQNVLLITIDTLRADRLSCYSKQHSQTPNIDNLAERGVLFTRAFANTSTTLPSHANILLGVSPLYHGVHDNLRFIVRKDFLSLAEHLKDNGYATAAFVGAYPLDSRFGLDQGFDTYDDYYPHDHNQQLTLLERRAEDVIEKALEGLKSLKSPWFVWIHCYDPHLPYKPPEPFMARFKKNPYDGEVAYVDLAMGKLLRYLDENHLFDSTMIVLTGDHGESLGQHGEMSHGFFAYNTTVWIPLIMNVPDVGPKREEQYVSHLDIFPTICDVVGVKKPSFLQGSSLLPVLKGKSLSDRPIYFESLYPYYSYGWAPLRGFIYGNEKFIDSPIPELYDLENDFDERMNLATRKIIDRYLKQLEEIIRDYFSPESVRSEEKLDRDVLKKLSSLGYISRSQDSKKEKFGPENDVKTLLPFYNKAYKAMTLYGAGKAKEAEELLRNIIKERKDIGISYFRLGTLYMDADKKDEAVEILRLGLSNVPGDYDIYRSYIKILRRASKFDEIIEDFHEESYREISVDPEIWNDVGFAYAKKGEGDKAIEAYDKALSLDNKYAEAYFNLGEEYLSQALKNRDQDLLKKSLRSFQEAIKVDQNYPSPYFGLGRAYRVLSNFDGAIHSLEKAVELQSDFDAAIYYLGLTYLDKGEKSKALVYFNTLKEKFFSRYPEDQKRKIEELIRRCKDENQDK